MSAENVAALVGITRPPVPCRVLLVEDDPALSGMYGLALRLSGHTVEVVANGLHVQGEVQRQAPDVVLLDVELPGLDGLSVLRLLRGGSTTARIPVVMLSNISEPAVVSEALELGAACYAVKSETTPTGLAQLLMNLQSHPRSLETNLADASASPHGASLQ